MTMTMTNKSLSTFEVRSTSVSKQYRKINLRTHNNKAAQIRVHRFALIGPGDTLFIDPNHIDHIYVLSGEDPNDKIQVVPHFEKTYSFKFGDSTLEFLMKEITTESELEDYYFLEGFHYKTSTAIVFDEKNGQNTIGPKKDGGRKAILMCYLRSGTNWQPTGYIELQMPLLMVKPRHTLLNNPFKHPVRQVEWDSWNAKTMKEYVNLIVRIARVVVHPDLRGLGVSRLLIKAARQYAKERWHINGRRPLFMEILAEMLKYMDFVSSSGMKFIGNTEGNLERVHQDLIFMQKGYKVDGGIMSLQKKYLTKFKGLSTQLNRSFEEVLNQLKKLTDGADEDSIRNQLNNFNPVDWYLFKKVLRFPIPYHLCGLDDTTQEYIDRYAPDQHSRQKSLSMGKNVRLKLNSITIDSRYKIPDSLSVRAIRDCFGIEGDNLNSRLLNPISIEASGGNIIFIAGPNGSGKSLLLRAIDPAFSDPNLIINIENESSSNYSVSWLNEINSDKPLIEYFSNEWGIEASISAFNQSGLSEAFIYLKPYKLLSKGQQYRASLAELILENSPVWLIDEFCSDLDPFTAKIVTNNLRKHVIKYGKIAFVAAANNLHFIDILKPTIVILLRQNANARIMNPKEYHDEFCIGSR